jgi:hypothetical protein
LRNRITALQQQQDIPNDVRSQLQDLQNMLATEPKLDPGDIEILDRSATLVEVIHPLPIPLSIRDSMYTALAQGLALYSDIRLRDSGMHMLDRMQMTFDMAQHIHEMMLPADAQQELGPALAWAMENSDNGAAVADEVARFVDLLKQESALPETLESDRRIPPILSTLKRNFSATRDALVAEARRADWPDSADAASRLTAYCDGLSDMLSAQVYMGRLPQTLADLSVIKGIKPAGGVEQQAMAAAQEMTELAPSAKRTSALQMLHDIDRLDSEFCIVREIHPQLTLEIAHEYTADSLPRIEIRWRTILIEQCDKAAWGLPMEKSQLDQMDAAVLLLKGLSEAQEVESAAKVSEAIPHWTDWNVTSQQIESVMQNYRSLTSAAVVGFANGDPSATASWTKIHDLRQPLFAVIIQTADCADGCKKFPVDAKGVAAELMTPIANQPFRRQRICSAVLEGLDYFQASNDPDAADIILGGLCGLLSPSSKAVSAELQ